MILILIMLGFNFVYSENSRINPDSKTKIIENLKLIENKYFKYLDFEERREAIRLLDEALTLLNYYSNTNYLIKDSNPNLLSDESLKELVKVLNDKRFDSERTDTIMAISKKGGITVKQLKLLLKTYQFDEGKSDCIVNVYDRIYDKINVNLLLTTISSEITKIRLTAFFNSK